MASEVAPPPSLPAFNVSLFDPSLDIFVEAGPPHLGSEGIVHWSAVLAVILIFGCCFACVVLFLLRRYLRARTCPCKFVKVPLGNVAPIAHPYEAPVTTATGSQLPAAPTNEQHAPFEAV